MIELELHAVGFAAARGASVRTLRDLWDGERSATTVTANAAFTATSAAARKVACAALEAGLRVATRSVAKSAGKAFAKAASEVLGKELARHGAVRAAGAALRGQAIGAAAGLVLEQGVDTWQLASGRIDRAVYGRRTVENVATACGSLAGSAIGAAVGSSICPGVGTAVGAAVGGVALGLALPACVRLAWPAPALTPA